MSQSNFCEAGDPSCTTNEQFKAVCPSTDSVPMSLGLGPAVGECDTYEIVTRTHRNERFEQGFRVHHLLWKQRRFALGAVVLGTMFFLVVAVLVPNSYESKTELMPPDFSSPTAFRRGTELRGNGLKSSGALLIMMPRLVFSWIAVCSSRLCRAARYVLTE